MTPRSPARRAAGSGAPMAAELLAGLIHLATGRTARGERGSTLRTESTLGAVVVVTGWALHRVGSRVGLPRWVQMSERGRNRCEHFGRESHGPTSGAPRRSAPFWNSQR